MQNMRHVAKSGSNRVDCRKNVRGSVILAHITKTCAYIRPRENSRNKAVIFASHF